MTLKVLVVQTVPQYIPRKGDTFCRSGITNQAQSLGLKGRNVKTKNKNTKSRISEASCHSQRLMFLGVFIYQSPPKLIPRRRHNRPLDHPRLYCCDWRMVLELPPLESVTSYSSLNCQSAFSKAVIYHPQNGLWHSLGFYKFQCPLGRKAKHKLPMS